MPQFFIESKKITAEALLLEEKSDIKHIIDVLRKKEGDEVLFIDENEILYTTMILEFSKNHLKAQILNKEKSIRTLCTDITLIQSVLKSSAQDFAIQKATEIGTKKILPITSKYTVVKFENSKDRTKKVEKWQKIAFESCKQCERSKAPEISAIRSFQEALSMDFDIKIACVERMADLSLKEFLRANSYKAGQKIALFVGPEGGWSDAEIESFSPNNIAKVSLGNMILRAETAVIAALSGVVYEYEN